jgi:hypothetical protein
MHTFTTRRSLRPLLALPLVAALASGCGGGAAASAFSPTFPDSDAGRVTALSRRLEATSPREAPGVVVGTTNGPSPQLFAWDVATGRALWSVPTAARGVPLVAGRLVLTDEGGRVVARSLRDGREVYALETEARHLIGADGEGALTAFTLSTGGGEGASSRIVLLEDGAERWTRDALHAVGAPAVHAGLVFVPWAHQNVTVFEAASGDETDRLHITDDVVGRAFVDGRDVYVAQAGAFRVTPSIASGSKASAAYHAHRPARALPGQPPFLPDAYAPPPAPDSAAARVRLAWAPAGSGETVTLADDTLYLLFYKLVFALSPDASAVRWVAQRSADIAGATAVPGGLLVADRDGSLALLGAADGRPVYTARLGVQPTVAVFAGSAPTASAPMGDPVPLRDQLLAAAENTDARLTPARVLAVQFLGALTEPEVTTNLTEICSGGRVPPIVQRAACEALGERTLGSEQLLAALGRHASFLEGTTAPPTAALARAAVRMQERRAVPLLVAHLRDPVTPADQLAGIVDALRQLGDRSAAEPIEEFLRLYHADEPSPALGAALGAAADALVALTGPVATDTLREIADDPLGMPAARGRAQEALDALAARQTAAEDADAAARAGTGTDAATANGTAAPGADTRPVHLGAADVERATIGVRRELIACLRADPARPRSARVIVIADGDGTITQVTASAAEACIAPLVRAQRLPAVRQGDRQQITYTLRP